MRAKKSGTLTTVIVILIFVAGLSLLLYPTVSNYWNSLHQSEIISSYDDEMSRLEQETFQTLLMEARNYNRELAENHLQYVLSEQQREVYYNSLKISSGSAMAYVEIPVIDCQLPIFHGTGDDVLERAVGHLEWSSLPVGGESTHCVISGHRGLPTSELLTNIDHMEKGDLFYIHVLGETLTYRVDQIAVVEPNDFSLLGIEKGADYVTLLTCTPYGINSHRLLVRGTRVDGGEDSQLIQDPSNEVRTLDSAALVVGVLLAVAVVVFVWLVIDSKRKKKAKGGKRLLEKEKKWPW